MIGPPSTSTLTPGRSTLAIFSASGTGPAIASQAGQAILTAHDGVTELRLDPEELGTVRFRLRSEAGRLVVVIAAERPDTLALLRRHASDLTAELRAAGHESVDLSFGSNAGGFGSEQAADSAAGNRPEPLAHPDPGENSRPRNGPLSARMAGASLYLRL